MAMRIRKVMAIPRVGVRVLNFNFCFAQIYKEKRLFLGHRSLIKNKTQTAVINIVNKRILINLTFHMLVNIHFQK